MKNFELTKLTIEMLDQLKEQLLKSYSLPELELSDNMVTSGCYGNCKGNCEGRCGGCTGSCSGGLKIF